MCVKEDKKRENNMERQINDNGSTGRKEEKKTEKKKWIIYVKEDMGDKSYVGRQANEDKTKNTNSQRIPREDK